MVGYQVFNLATGVRFPYGLKIRLKKNKKERISNALFKFETKTLGKGYHIRAVLQDSPLCCQTQAD
jgi:hypothetical protein